MAMQGGYFGCNAHSGQGGAFRQIGAVKIAAFTVVNAYGAVTDRAGWLVACNRPKSWGNLTMTSELLRNLPQSLKANWDAAAMDAPDAGGTRNTTVSLIVTNQKLDTASLQRMAVQVHTSMARAIQPFSTSQDGDTLYAASTQEIDSELTALTLTTIAGETMWDAVLASVPDKATPVPPPQTPATVSADKLAAYAGTYDFGAAPAAGGFGGMGVDVRIEDGSVKASPIDGFSAAGAGLLAGDIITHLNGAPLKGLPLNTILGRMRGPSGSTAVLTVVHNGQDRPTDIAVVREMLRLRPLLRVRFENAGLLVEATGGRQVFDFERSKPTAVFARSDTEFYADGRSATRIAFTVDATGKVSGAVLNPGRWEQKGVKID
jgi:hypothetical protein